MKKILLVVSLLAAFCTAASAQDHKPEFTLKPVKLMIPEMTLGLKCDNGCSAVDCLNCFCGVGECLPGFTDCLVDPNNCGAIGNACDTRQDCVSGTCEPPLVLNQKPPQSPPPTQ